MFIPITIGTAGQKLKKTVVDGTTTKIVDYLDGFQTEARGSRIPEKMAKPNIMNNEQYAGEVLQFFPHPEGYVKATPANKSLNSPPTSYSYNYVFNYTDHLDERNQSIALVEVCERSSVRLSYAKDPATSLLHILEENHYYPFGLKHEFYVSGGKHDYRRIPDTNDPKLIGVTQTDYQYKYQGQERQDELGLNWDSFKWRNYDYAIGRFMSVDPLAEGYEWQSVYAFGSNQPVHAKEIEGLESEDDKSLMNRVGSVVMAGMRWVNEYINPLTPIVETVTGTSYSSNWTEKKPRLQSVSEAGMSFLPGGKAVGTFEKVTLKAVEKEVVKDVATVSLDNNALIAAVEGGEKLAVKNTIGDRQAIVSTQAAKEFLQKGDKQSLKNFMKETGAKMSTKGGSEFQIKQLQSKASEINRVLKSGDAKVAADAINNNAEVITRDKKFQNLLIDFGVSVSSF